MATNANERLQSKTMENKSEQHIICIDVLCVYQSLLITGYEHTNSSLVSIMTLNDHTIFFVLVKKPLHNFNESEIQTIWNTYFEK